mmetsp:Transcript_37154/g.116950  ORF Transcript_37154/g.116950 Transcript_37154/m.116950 type:complete len:112 (+) Transcript_37154:429-764(+)
MQPIPAPTFQFPLTPHDDVISGVPVLIHWSPRCFQGPLTTAEHWPLLPDPVCSRCNADGSFTYDQYAGNLECSGQAVTKTFHKDVCEPDVPPTIHSKPVDISCCTGAGSEP